LGSFFLLGRIGGSDEGSPEDTEVGGAAGNVSIEGRWIFESWEEGDERITVEVGVNAAGEPWLEFRSDGTFGGSTGCNDILPAGYEYAAGFLMHGDFNVTAADCEPGTAEEVLLTVLSNTPDGVEVIMDGDRMEWFGSNLEGATYPITFRRDDAPPPETTTTMAAAEDGVAIQVHEVDGVEVVVPSQLSELPDHATRVEFNTTVIDSGAGPELCLGGVDESLPPQCSGPVATGLDMDGWSQQANGVRWGERSVVVSWPPVDGSVEVISQSEILVRDLVYPPGELPEECEDTETDAGAGAVNEYAASLGGANGGLYVANDGTLVLQVVGDPTPHRETMSTFGGACVVEVPRSEAEQRRIQDTIVPLLAEVPELAGNYGVGTGPGGRVEIHVPVADRATAQAVAGLVDDPTAIRLVASGVLLP
jgi:hypothetical protein